VKTLCLQFQPNRSGGIDHASVTKLMARIAIASPTVREFVYELGTDKGSYVNYCFTAKTIQPIWAAIYKTGLRHRKYGPALRRSTIVACMGSKGWGNYLLLHHFDQKQQLDMLKLA
jgi:hypothetical protein